MKETVKKDRAVDIRFLAMDLPRLFATMSYGLIYRPKRVYISDKRPDKKSGALVIANHSSFTDPVLIGISMGRRMWYLAGELAMGNKLKSFLLTGCGCIGIDRNISDIDGIRKAVNVMKRGHYLLMFPQGRLERDGEIKKLKSGAVLMAWQAGVSILPVYIKKGAKWYNRAILMVGEEFHISDYCDKKMPSMKDIENLTDITEQKMHECEHAYYEYLKAHGPRVKKAAQN
ncbi:MAG: 1-acyl-sn-glycerol-3-phosphate acyltransferase [Lachnospiraceae bacterium]|nr:1-acyl-sn-glycerol-3-phosphate acyltransferase [Lachnospiraceae bacterium]